MALGKGAKPTRLFDAQSFKAKAREGSVVALRKEIVTVATKAADSTDEIPKIDFVLSTAAVDRMKDTINQDGWILDPYFRNNVVLWAHDQNQKPVAKAPTVAVMKSGDVSRLVSLGTEFTPRDLYEEGWAVGQMYLRGFLHAVSVGFLPHTYQFNEERGGWAVDFLTQELLEFSCVPVPANPEALIGAKSAGIPIGWVVDWAEKILDVRTEADGFNPSARAYVEELRRTVAPATFAAPGQKDAGTDDDAAADEALLEGLAGVEAAILQLTAAVQVNTAAIQANTAAELAEKSVQTSAPLVAAAAPTVTAAELSTLVRASVATRLADRFGRKP